MSNQTAYGDIIFEARDLCVSAHRYDAPPKPILKNVHFNVRRGEVVALIGESGSGKTTASLAALGYCKPGLFFAGGDAILNGRELTTMPAAEIRSLRGVDVAYLAQSADATFNPSLQLGDQVIEASVLHGLLNPRDARRRTLDLFSRLELPDAATIGNRYPHQVSGGQAQRVMAAMALCGHPKLLVLDEPTTALDVTTQIEVLRVFKNVIKNEGTAAIYVSHDLAVVAQIANKVVVLYDGEVKESGPTDTIINRPCHPYTKKLIASTYELVIPDVIEAGVPKSVRRSMAPTLMELKDVDAGYGKTRRRQPTQKVLKDINISIKRGKTLAVIGESGSGKSTLARVMAGLLPASSGRVRLNGEDLPPDLRHRTRSQLKRVQFVYQTADTALNPRMRIREIIGRPLGFYLGLDKRARRKRTEQILELVELPTTIADHFPHELSGGQKQRVSLARALAAEPDIILCDEVTSALDNIVARNLMEMLSKLQKEKGLTFVFISHDLSIVSTFADEIAVLCAGQIVEQGAVDDVLNPPCHPYTQLLISSVPKLEAGWLEQAVRSRQTGNASASEVDLS